MRVGRIASVTELRSERRIISACKAVREGRVLTRPVHNTMSNPFTSPFCVYAIYSINSKFMYIGTTKNTAFNRLMSHVIKALNPKGKLYYSNLYRWFRKVGLQSLRVLPVFHVTEEVYKAHWEEMETAMIRYFQTQFSENNVFKLNASNQASTKVLNGVRLSTANRTGKRKPPGRLRLLLPRLGERRIFHSSDWKRRLIALFSCDDPSPQINSFSVRSIRKICSIILGTQVIGIGKKLQFRTQALNKDATTLRLHTFLHDWCESHPCQVEPKTMLRRLRTRLADLLCHLKTPSLRVVLHFSTRAFNSRSLLRKVRMLDSLLPDVVKTLGQTGLVFKAGPSIGQLAYNFTKNVLSSEPQSCHCNKWPAEFKINGHVNTNDLSAVRFTPGLGAQTMQEIQTFLSYGSGFIPRLELSDDALRDQLNQDLIDWSVAIQRRVKQAVNIADFKSWRQAVLDVLMEGIKGTTDPSQSGQCGNSNVGVRVPAGLKTIQKYFVIHATDKAGRNLALACHRDYHNRTRIPFEDKLLYREITNWTVEEAIHEIQNEFKGVCKLSVERLAHQYLMPKRHKTVPKDRFIQAASNTTLTTISLIIDTGLALLEEGLQKEAIAYCKQNGVNYWWAVKSSLDVVSVLARLNERNTPYTPSKSLDIAGFYEQIPHAELLSALEEDFDRIIALKRKKFIQINWRRREARLVCDKPQHNSLATRTFSVREFITLVQTQMENNFLRFENRVFIKTKGIDMGANDSPRKASLFASNLERKFILKLVADGKLDIAKKFYHVVRQMDDVLFTHFPEGIKFASQIYPPQWFELTIDDGAEHKLEFLDLCIFKGSDGLTAWKHWSKTEKFNFDVVSFPHALSWLPENNKAPSLVGRIIHFSRTNRFHSDFIRTTALLCQRLIERNGWKAERVMQILKHMESKYHVSELSEQVKRVLTSLNAKS